LFRLASIEDSCGLRKQGSVNRPFLIRRSIAIFVKGKSRARRFHAGKTDVNKFPSVRAWLT
jgi:hypothetical protein